MHHSGLSTAQSLAGLTAMWMLMMTAMMAPVAWPWLRAFQRFDRDRRLDRAGALASTLTFSSGYLTAWLGYAIAATALQMALLPSAGHEDPLPLSSMASAVILIGAGVYQFAAAKRACLTHCRNPLTYFLRRWRDGPTAGFRLGFGHGLFCVGCCWALMLTALVVGMSHVGWMLALTAVVFTEQVVPHGYRLRAPLGIALVVAGVARL
jgi:predicted metal-binding membrane protein